jgi:glucose dehydrogenase
VADNNPFSEKDEELRGKAEERVRYWKGYKVASVPSTPKKPVSSSSGSNVTDRDGVYVAYANGIVRDTSTGLEWKVGPDRDMNYDEARNWVRSRGEDWRMPTMDELEGLYKSGKGNRDMTPLLETTGWRVWSGEEKGSSGAWDFDFTSGGRRWLSRYHSNYGIRAFAVRSRSDG